MNIDLIRKSYKTVHEMLNVRNYKINSYVHLTDEELLNRYNLDNCMITGTKNEEKILVVFFDNCSLQKISLESMKKIIAIYIGENTDNITNFIFAINTKLTHRAEKELMELEYIKHEIFFFDELSFNIMTHKYQPKFRVLNEKEKERMFQTFKNKIPYIKITDPVSRHYNVKVGDIFEILRNDDSLYYRLVVK